MASVDSQDNRGDTDHGSAGKRRHTDCDWPDLDSFFEVRIGGIVRIETLKDLFATESVHKGGASCLRLMVSAIDDR